MMEPQESLPESKPSKGRSKMPWVIGGILAGAVGICGVVVLILYLTGVLALLPFFGPQEIAPTLMPADTAIYVSVDPHLEDVAGYQYLAGIYGDIAQVTDAVDEGLAQMESELGISYQDDIKPWLGPEVGLGITGMAEAVDQGGNPIVILVAVTKDKKASDAFLEKMRAGLEAQGEAVNQRTVEKTSYYVREAEGDWDTPLVFGAVKKAVVLTSDENAMVGVINRASGEGDTLADQETDQELLQALPAGTAAYLFMDAQEVSRASMVGAEAELQMEAPELALFESYRAIGMAVNLDLTGIQVDVVSTFDPEGLPQETVDSWTAKEGSAGRILARIPADALGFISGQDLATGWRTLYRTLTQTPDFEEMAQAWSADMGLSLDEDYLDWQSGEYALVVVEAAGGPEDVPFGLFATCEVGDRSGAESTMRELAAAVENSVGLPFLSRSIGGIEMQIFQVPFTNIMLGYGFPGERLVIGFLEDALEDAVAEVAQPITADASFRAVRDHLPEDVSGIVYINTRDVWPMAFASLGDQGGEALGEDPRPFLEPIKAIGMGTSPPDLGAGVSRAVLFVYITGE
jgi:hypothetical protein